jgi:hypothetical protein
MWVEGLRKEEVVRVWDAAEAPPEEAPSGALELHRVMAEIR